MLWGYFISLLTNLFTEPDFNTLTLPGNAMQNQQFNLLVQESLGQSIVEILRPVVK